MSVVDGEDGVNSSWRMLRRTIGTEGGRCRLRFRSQLQSLLDQLSDGPTLYTEHIHIRLLIFTHECMVLGLLKRVFGRSRARFAAANARSTKVLHLPRITTEKIDMVVVCLEKKNPYASHHIHSFPGIYNSIAQDPNNVQTNPLYVAPDNMHGGTKHERKDAGIKEMYNRR